MAFERMTQNVLNVSALPNAVTGQASSLKATFDAAGVSLKTFINALLDVLEANGAESIGADVSSVTTKTVQAILTAFEAEIANRYTKAEINTLVAEDTNDLVSDLDVNLTTGVITITKKDGTIETIDTAMEKIPATFTFVENGGAYYLKITNIDGSSTQVNVTDLFNIYNFSNSNEIAFTKTTDGNTSVVSASIRANSIGIEKLSLSAITQIEEYVSSAAASASTATTKANEARTSATSAQNSASTATTKANEASSSARSASDSANSASNSASAATGSEKNAKESEKKAEESATGATAAATTATSQANLSKSYAVGGTGTREGEETDNAQYYVEQARTIVAESRENDYGIKRQLTSTSSAWTRIANSVGLVANATKNGGTVQNDFDNIYPWSDIKTYNYDVSTGKITAWIGDADFKFDGSNGEVLTRIPEFYFNHIIKDGYEYYYITRYAKAGYTKSEEFSVGRYKMSEADSKGHSFSGAAPSVWKTLTQHRNLAKALGDGFGQMDWRYFILQMLYLVEYADYNSQTKLGNGSTGFRYDNTAKALVAETNTNRIVVATTSSFIVGQQIDVGTSQGGRQIAKDRTVTAVETYSQNGITGTAITFDGDAVNVSVGNFLYTCPQKSGQCDSLGMKSGCLYDGKHSMIYRGIEDIFGNVFEWIDGINIKDRVPYICYDPTKYAVDKFDGEYEALDYTLASADGYAKTLGFDQAHPLIALTTSIGGGSTTYLCDYSYQNSGNRVLCVGGSFYDGAVAGLWYFNASDGSSSSNVSRGARLLKY